MQDKFEYENFFSKPEKVTVKQVIQGIGVTAMAMFSLWVFVILFAALEN